MDQVEVRGLRIAFQRRGSGPPLLLLHGGYGCDSRAWRMQLDDLADEFTVVAWDMPGHGQSSDPPETFGLRDFADVAADFIGALELDRPHVLGLSFGGGLAIELYRRHPTLPQTLVLAGAYAGWAGSLPADVVEERLQRAMRESELPPKSWLPAYMPGMLSPSASPDLVEELMSIMLDIHPAGLRAELRAFAKADLRDVLPTIDVPTLVLHGEHDQRAPRHVAENLHARIPESTLVVLTGVGHVSNVEAPALFNDAVREFLRTCSTINSDA
jgi:pimeloyl-ACP methyl ester carboxylesterase